MELKDFAVGQKWNTRGDFIATIIGFGDTEDFPINVTIDGRPDGDKLTENGKFFTAGENRFDLVSLVEDVQVGVGVLEESDVMACVAAELASARAKWPKFNSAHEGFAVMEEEVDELWTHVKTNQKRRDLAAMKREAIQVAAMAIRFAEEVCSEEAGRK